MQHCLLILKISQTIMKHPVKNIKTNKYMHIFFLPGSMACHLEFPELTISWCYLSCCHGIANVLLRQGAGLAWPVIRICPFAVHCRYFSLYCMMETGWNWLCSQARHCPSGLIVLALQVLRLQMYCHHAKFRWQNPVPAT